MREFFRELVFHVKAAVRLWPESVKLRLAMRLSDIKQRARNRRFFVVLMTVGFDKKGRPVNRLRSIDNEGFRYCKRKGWLPKRMTYLELQRKCFYSTSLTRNNRLSREEREKAMKRYRQYVRLFGGR